VLGMALDELPRWVGQLGQVARIDCFVDDNGTSRGARRIRMVTGGGLEAELHPDRCLDLGNVTYRGMPMAWVSPVGVSSPTSFEPSGDGWLRTFGGGLLATCGLDSFGPASVHEGVQYGLHGRVGARPATVVRCEISQHRLVVSAEVRQAALFGENLRLQRTVTADIGGTELHVEDVVHNDGWSGAGHMILYHCNLGWPLLDHTTAIDIPSRAVRPRDEDAACSNWRTFPEPDAAFREQVHVHTGFGAAPTVAVDNATIDTRLELSFDSHTLPALFQWTLAAEGDYVLGLEPANTPVIFGRAAAAQAGELPYLPPRSSVRYRLGFAFGPSRRSDRRPTPTRSMAGTST